MYIKYNTPQEIADPLFTEYITAGGKYRPTWLIRTSDWEKVPGEEAINGYCSLSYCWEQSGEVYQRKDGSHTIKDDGYHRINTTSLERRKNRRSTRYRWKTHSRYVTYTGIIQQICRDFNIDYLWYDKICINQTDKTEKYHEIKQMHLIYSNARYTVAFVPEIYITDPKEFQQEHWFTKRRQAKHTAFIGMRKSLWWQRSWTLEELMMSTRILIVGQNTHFWSLEKAKCDPTKESDSLSTSMLGFKNKALKSANMVLSYAHFRNSSREHDKLFAMTNIFNDILPVEVDYDTDFTAAVHALYRRLAEDSLTVMCFGTVVSPSNKLRFETTMGTYRLPSWTGVAGLHSNLPVSDTVLDRHGKYSIDDSMHLRIACRSYTLCPVKYDDYGAYDDVDDRGKQATVNFEKTIHCASDVDGGEQGLLDWGQWCIDYASSCFATHYWKPNHPSFASPILPLSLTTDCKECVFLALLFVSAEAVLQPESTEDDTLKYNSHYLLPVLRKSNTTSFYEAIGIIQVKLYRANESVKNPEQFLDEMFKGLNDELTEFVIQ